MEIVIQKFGGTSVKDVAARKQALVHVKYAVDHGKKVVVVVSAFREPGASYTTDGLLNLVHNNQSRLSKRELDMLVSVGEIVSATVFTEQAREAGLDATALTGSEAGIVTDDEFQNAKILNVDPTPIKKMFKKTNVVVVAGFQGATKDGEITTIGRGGSDVSAAVLGMALNAELVDIFTDVNGIMTADPQLVKRARCIKAISYDELANLAHNGARVIHPRAVEVAKQANLSMRIRATYQQPEELGTIVGERNPHISHYRTVTGITNQNNLTQFSVSTENLTSGQIFQLMAAQNLSIDFINISTDSVVFNLPQMDTWLAEKTLATAHANYRMVSDCAKVAIVGAGITGTPGITARIVNTLAKHHIDILQSTDSYTTIWVLIHKTDLTAALNSLHDEFLQSHQFTLTQQ